MEMDLVQLQQSSLPIRNPFGFDFTVKWAGKPITLKGDGEWKQVLKPLRDHLANRLYMKIRYQFHDEQVAAMKAKGDSQGARGYSVPAGVENKIWMLITGEPKDNKLPVADDLADEADLTILKKEISTLEKKAAAQNGGALNITKLLQKATVEALPTANAVSGKSASGHVGGSGSLAEAPIEGPQEADTTPANAEDIQAEAVQPNPSILPADGPTDAPADPAVAAEASTDGEFGELNELDNESK